MKQRVNLQRSITDENDIKLLNEVELEIAKMKLFHLVKTASRCYLPQVTPLVAFVFIMKVRILLLAGI